MKDEVLPNLICPGYVRRKKLEKKISNSTDVTNSRENSDDSELEDTVEIGY